MQKIIPCTLLLLSGVTTLCAERPSRQFDQVAEHADATVLHVKAHKNCIFMNQTQRPDDAAVKMELKVNCRYTVTVSGAAFLSQETGRQSDPMPGVVIFYPSHGQDGYTTECRVAKPGDVFQFHTPKRNQKGMFLSAFFIDYWPESENRGEYQLTVESRTSPTDTSKEKRTEQGLPSEYGLNLTFAFDPGPGKYNGVIGNPSDHWNYIGHGQAEVAGLLLADGTVDDVTVQLSANDGNWGIEGRSDAYHGYIYHNCRCVDLTATIRYLPAGEYDVLVYAHGDAPAQNAAIEIQSSGRTHTGKSTLNDGTWDFRSLNFKAGNQYVQYRVTVKDGEPMTITSKRDGSLYAMLNAIQLRRVK